MQIAQFRVQFALLRKKVLQDDVKGSAGNAEEVAAQGLEV